MLIGTLLTACAAKPLPPPPGWPLLQLKPPPGAKPLPLAEVKPPNRPYYSSSSDESIMPAISAQARLLGGLRATGTTELLADNTFRGQPVVSSDGTSGRGWGMAFRMPSGWNSALAQCEEVLHMPEFAIVEYVPGQVRTYRSHDRRTEVVLVAGKGDQLLLAICQYGVALPSERELADRAEAAHAAHRLVEAIKAEALELGSR
jgi:hypothetical protein